MLIYKFSLNTYHGVAIKKKIVEVEEKPKSYTVLNKTGWVKRILKSDIGKAVGFLGDEVFLLEDDIEKAKKLFVEELRQHVQDKTLQINALEQGIKEAREIIALIESMESED